MRKLIDTEIIREVIKETYEPLEKNKIPSYIQHYGIFESYH
jgi:hypothetical protein